MRADNYHILTEDAYKTMCNCLQVLTKLSDAIDDTLISTTTTWSSDKINSVTEGVLQDKDIIQHNLAEINSLINISDEELATYRQLIDDTNAYDDKTWSSAKLDKLISDLQMFKTSIDDLLRTQTTTWSSSKIAREINNKIYKLDFVQVNINDDNEYLIPLENATKLIAQEGGKLVLPDVPTGESVEIHTVFEGKDLTVFQMPKNVKWQDGVEPRIFSGKTYELIFEYVDSSIGWLGWFTEHSFA